jgi:hypothetical protein
MFCLQSAIVQTPIPAIFSSQLLAPYLVNCMLTFVLAVFFKLYFRRTFGHTNTCAIVPVAALAAFKPDILPFALLFSHKIRPDQAGLITRELQVHIDILAWCASGRLQHFLIRTNIPDSSDIFQAIIFVTTPAPTVRPPSRIAKRRPSSIAIGAIISTSIAILSPGMHISALLPSLLINA